MASAVNGLTKIAFSWSVQDMFNEELYKHEVENIPECFESRDEYRNSYKFPLIEETRVVFLTFNDDLPSISFKVQTSKDIKIDHESMHNSLFAVFLTNMSTNTRIWNGLGMSGNMSIIDQVLCTNSVALPVDFRRTNFLNSETCWSSLVDDSMVQHCFFRADEDKEIAKGILEVKNELSQLDDLLNGDSIPFKSARWKVLFSDNVKKSFGNIESLQKQKFVINLLLKLSNGWRPRKLKGYTFCGSPVQLVKQYKVGGLYILSSVDIAKDTSYTQVLKIWDILPLEEIPKLVNRLDNIFSMYTDDYLNRCKLKNIEGDLEVPIIWKASDEIVKFKKNAESGDGSTTGLTDGRSHVEDSKVRDSLLLMKFYSISYGVVNHLLSGNDGREFDLPFEVTNQELEIIRFPISILERYGTGKTTVLTMILFQKEQKHHLS